LIEYSLTLPYGIGQISGLEVQYNSNKPAMQRLSSLKINGKKIVDSNKYTVSTSGYLAKGGDGYTIFTEGKLINEEQSFPDALYRGFKAMGEVKLPSIGRQIDLSGDLSVN
jgi:2',3'-cyclic-nucleotide 2'-phosphodiesterase (5'-nucleotidase family)